jgi:hypothetical protein
VELDVEEGLVAEGRAMEDMCEGYCVGGVWRDVGPVREGEEMEVVREKLVRDAEIVRRVGGGEVMDASCVGVVREVWSGVGGCGGYE